MFIVLPEDKTFQHDLKKHTVIKKGEKSYTGTYATFMQDMEDFKNTADTEAIKNTFINLKKYYELVSDNVDKINGHEIIKFNEEHKDEIPTNGNLLFKFWSDDNLVQKYALDPIKQQIASKS